jgi:hypothetical protein
MTGLEAIEAICNGDIDAALNWARERDVDVPDDPKYMNRHPYGNKHFARHGATMRFEFIKGILDHLRSTDPDSGIVSGRLEALAEQFRRRADRAHKEKRYKEADIWVDAETDTIRLIPDE